MSPNNYQDFFSGTKPIVLIIGDVGFLGSFLAESFLSKGIKVVCLDEWVPGQKINTYHLLENKNYLFINSSQKDFIPNGILRANYVVQLVEIDKYFTQENLNKRLNEENFIHSSLIFSQKQNAKFLLVSTLSSSIEGNRGVGEFLGEDLQPLEKYVLQFGQQTKTNVRVVRIGDLYGPRMSLFGKSPIGRVIRNVLFDENNNSNYQSSTSLYPVYVNDAVEGLIKGIFSAGTKNTIIEIAGPETKVSEIFQQTVSLKAGKEPFAGIQHKGVNSLTKKRGEVFVWNPTTELKKGLQESIFWLTQNKQWLAVGENREDSDSRERSLNWEAKVEKKKKNTSIYFSLSYFISKLRFLFYPIRTVIFPKNSKSVGFKKTPKDDKQKSLRHVNLNLKQKLLTGGLVLSCIGFLFYPLVVIFFGVGEMSLARNALAGGEIKKATTFSSQAEYWFNLSRDGYNFWNNIPFFANYSDKYAQDAQVLSDSAKVTILMSRILEQSGLLADNIIGENEFDPKVYSDNLSLELQNLDQELGFLQAEIGNYDTKNQGVFSTIKPLKDMDIVALRKMVVSFSEVINVLPEVLGSKEKKTYMVIFADNNELRPIAGHVSSYALITFEKGRMINYDAQNIGVADSQLKGHVDPPLALKNFLGQTNWLLQDANWSPDYPTSAQKIAWFFNKEMSQKINGVVVLDQSFVRQFVGLTKQTKLLDDKSTFLATNLNEKLLEQNIRSDLQETDISTNLLAQIGESMAKKPREYLVALVKSASLSLSSRRMAIWIEDPVVSRVLSHIGWDSSLPNVACSEKQGVSCFGDYLQVVDANLGVNKANYYLQRSYNLELGYETGYVFHRLTVDYTNNSQAGTWPGGDYKNYLRIVVPQSSVAQSFTLSNGLASMQQQVVTELGKEKDKATIGGFILVPAQESRQVTIVWKTPAGQLEGGGQLNLYWQKQLGTDKDPVILTINSLPGFKTSSSVLTDGKVVGYNTTLGHDILTTILWQHE